MRVEPNHTPEHRYVEANGLRLHYLDWGRSGAPPLLLLHGARSNAHAFDQAADRLRERFHVMAMDHRGHGDSAWSTEGYGVYEYAADLAAVAHRLSIGAFDLVGHSLGGMVAMTFAWRYPDLLRRLVIVDVGPELNRDGIELIRSETMESPAEFASVDDAFAFARARDPLPSDGMLRYRTYHGLKQLPSGKWTWKADPALMAQGLPGPSDDEYWAMLGSISCPTLVLRGEVSALLTRHVARRMTEVLPEGRLLEVSKAGHRVMLDNPKGFLGAIQGFLAG